MENRYISRPLVTSHTASGATTLVAANVAFFRFLTAGTIGGAVGGRAVALTTGAPQLGQKAASGGSSLPHLEQKTNLHPSRVIMMNVRRMRSSLPACLGRLWAFLCSCEVFWHCGLPPTRRGSYIHGLPIIDVTKNPEILSELVRSLT